MVVANYAYMNAPEEGALHHHYENAEGDEAVWYVFGLLLRASGYMNTAAFNQYANRWDVCPSAIARNALQFGYYHGKEV